MAQQAQAQSQRSAAAIARRELLVRAGLVGLSILVTLLLLEVGLRVGSYRPAGNLWFVEADFPQVRSAIPGVKFALKPFQQWGLFYPSNPRGYFDERSIIWYQTNNAGYRGRDFALEKHPGTMRIVFLGDSFGFGHGVKKEDVVTARLEDRLNQQSACPIEIYNFSVPGYGTADEAALLEYTVLQYQPDLIIVWYFLNDPGTSIPALYSPQFMSRLRGYSWLADFVGAKVDRVIRHYSALKSYRDQYRDTDARWILAKWHLERMAKVARGIPIYLFVHPELFRLADYPFQDVHRKVVLAARGYGFQAFDLMEVFRDRGAEALWVHPLDHHPNEEAHRLAAEYVAGVLEQAGAVCRFE